MTQEQFNSAMDNIWDVVNHRPEYMRKGQALYNQCYNRFRHYNPPTLRNTEVDCYYNDKNIEIFVEALCNDLID